MLFCDLRFHCYSRNQSSGRIAAKVTAGALPNLHLSMHTERDFALPLPQINNEVSAPVSDPAGRLALIDGFSRGTHRRQRVTR